MLSTAARDILAPVNFPSNLLGLGVALGIGLLIGAERERRKGLGPLRSAAGVRTFALASLGGALCLILGGELLLVAAVLGAFAFSAISYTRSRAADPGLTSEFALVVAVLLGALAIRQPALAAGLGVVTTVLLASRDLLHRWLRDLLTEQEAHDALLFLAAALIILPLTPDRTIGPMGIFEPRKLWELVVLVLAIAGAGHIATRAFGWRYGLPLAGLLGGFVSATATIGSMELPPGPILNSCALLSPGPFSPTSLRSCRWLSCFSSSADPCFPGSPGLWFSRPSPLLPVPWLTAS